MKTLGFKEKEKGWVSFFSFVPESYLRLGGKSFCIYKGQLWEQNDKTNPITNTFFGVKYPSKINTVFNDVNTEDKIFKTFFIEGSSTWNVGMKTNLTSTSLKASDFHKRESRFFAHLRGNELENDFTDVAQGIGVAIDFEGKTVSFKVVSSLVNIGDKLFKLNGTKEEVVGTIVSKENNTIVLDQYLQGLVTGLYFFSKKDGRIDGAGIRGYYADVELTNEEDGQVELFAINSNIIKSYV